MRQWLGKMLFITALVLVPARVLGQAGDVTGVHDPSIIQSGNTFYLFSTGRGIVVHTSIDLFNWKKAGPVFEQFPNQVPDWTRNYNARENSMWAPDISLSHGEYRLYYAVSSFGKTASAIGLVTNTTLDPSSKNYAWVDRGKVIDTPEHNSWNAIDPCAFEDTDGRSWLVLGSCWRGIKLLPLDAKTGLLADPAAPPVALAAHPPTNIIEEGYIRRHGDDYYLWVSVDHCCRGIASDYRILVGRSKQVTGPYLDRDSRPMRDGGGTLVLASYGAIRGPGSCAIVHFADHDFLVHHQYDADHAGTPTLQIRRISWSADGWPLAGEPMTRPADAKPSPPVEVMGAWSVRRDYGNATLTTLTRDGMVAPGGSTWRQAGQSLEFSWPADPKRAKELVELDPDNLSFVGRMSDGTIISGVRAATSPAATQPAQ